MTNPNVVKTLLATVPTDKPSKPTTPSSQITPTTPNQGEVPAPAKRLITGGASTGDLLDEWRANQKIVYDKYDVTTS